MDDAMTKLDCSGMFVRMMEANGFIQGTTTNSITYDEFNTAFFFGVYDLSVG